MGLMERAEYTPGRLDKWSTMSFRPADRVGKQDSVFICDRGRIYERSVAMFLLHRPDRATIEAFLDRQRGTPFSYPEPGATRGTLPSGYVVDRYRERLGAGRPVFDQAILALNRWAMFETGWTHLCFPDAPIKPGTIICTLASHLGFWSLNACRIVYVIDRGEPDADGISRYGFAFGTLAAHAERGEERFTVEHHSSDDSVWYDVLAFSRPGNFLSTLGYPITRALQKRFARDSRRAMRSATTTNSPQP
jgi:uncharacterized protein (UPF0548 family)